MRKFALLTIVCIVAFIAKTTAQAWDQAGNVGTTSSKLGTTNAAPLNLYTKNLPRVTVDTLGRVGINTSTPSGYLYVKSSGGNPTGAWAVGGNPVFTGIGEGVVGNANFNLSMASGVNNGRGIISFRRSRGLLSAPTAVLANDHLGSISVNAFDGSTFQSPGGINFYADGTPAAGLTPMRISLVTGSSSATSFERLVVKNDGKVGLSTTNPAARLDVVGTNAWDLSSTEGDFRLGDNTYRLKMGVANSGGGAGDAYIASSGRLFLGTAQSVARSQSLTIANNGNIGISTVAPTSRLHVVGDTLTAPVVNVVGSYSGPVDVRAIQASSVTADGYGYGVYATGGYMGGRFLSTAGAYTGGAYGVYATSTGTAGARYGMFASASGSPDYAYGVYGSASGGTVDNWGGYFPTKTYTNELRVGGTKGATGYVAAINGKLIAEEVRVELMANWPDYVFRKDYKLMTLEELEKKIHADKHLPGIPAADEMKKSGIMVGEMQTKTMEKVEENTLYILQLNNKIKELEKKIEELTKLIK